MRRASADELIADSHCAIAENPLWHADEQCLYWVDIPRGTIFRLDPATMDHEIVHQGDVTGGFTIQADGSLLLFCAAGAVRQLKDGQLTTVHAGLAGEAQHRFNDVIADARGRVLAGTVAFTTSNHSGRLYLFDVDGSVRVLRDDLLLSNGLGFSPDGRILYHADSLARVVMQYDYDVEDGTIAHPRIFASLPESNGVPDGLTVDAEGFVWLAVWDGYRLVRYAPNGDIERTVMFPAKKVSSLTFGGADATDIFVTTAGGDHPAENGATAGGIFRLRLGIRGIPEFRSRIPI